MTLQNLYARQALKNYSFYALFSLVMGLFSYSQNDAANLIALKVIFSPFFLLATRGIPTFFKMPLVVNRFSLPSIEFHLLMAAVFAGFMSLISWHPNKSAFETLTTLGIAFIVMAVTQMLILLMRIRRERA